MLEAARAVFAARGAVAEIKDIAEAAGVGVGTIYRHFPGKEALLTALIHRALDEIESVVEAAERTTTIRPRLQVIVEGTLRVHGSYGWLMEALLAGTLAASSRDAIRADAESRNFDGRIQALLAAGIEAGELRGDLDSQLGTLVLQSLLSPWMYEKIRSRREPDGVAGALVDIFLRGAAAHRHEPANEPGPEAAG